MVGFSGFDGPPNAKLSRPRSVIQQRLAVLLVMGSVALDSKLMSALYLLLESEDRFGEQWLGAGK